jgi:Tol biopolymer transport system component
VRYAQGRDALREALTPLRLSAGSPDWSPDGKRIVFNSSYEGQAAVEIYTVRPDGTPA